MDSEHQDLVETSSGSLEKDIKIMYGGDDSSSMYEEQKPLRNQPVKEDYGAKYGWANLFYFTISLASILAVAMTVYKNFDLRGSDESLLITYYIYQTNDYCIYCQDTESSQQYSRAGSLHIIVMVFLTIIFPCISYMIHMYNQWTGKEVFKTNKGWIKSIPQLLTDLSLSSLYSMLFMYTSGCLDAMIIGLFTNFLNFKSQYDLYKDSQYCYRIRDGKVFDDHTEQSSDNVEYVRKLSFRKRDFLKSSTITDLCMFLAMFIYLILSNSSGQTWVLYFMFFAYRIIDLIGRVKFYSELFYLHRRGLFTITIFWIFYGCIYTTK
jgi:hypothetical protein